VDSVASGCGPSPPAGAEGRGSPTSAGAPSPDRSHVIALSHGRTLTVRTARPEDLEGVRALYAGLSLDDRYHRFFSGAGTPAGYVEAWVHLPERGGVTLVAVVSTDTDRIVGEAGYALLGDGDGEFGITIAADWRGGLGPYLLDVLIEEAAARGVPNLQAEILTDNRAMLGLVWERGYAMLDHTDLASVRVTISTTGHTPSWPADDRRARVLVEMAGGRWPHERAVRDAGFQVITCPGPGPQSHCPVLAGKPCPLASDADVIVFALRPNDPHANQVLARHPRLHHDTPLVVQATPNDAIRAPEHAVTVPACTPAAQVIALLGQLAASHPHS
jgi:hypothetical protein